MEGSSHLLHVALLASPGMGHLTPSLELAKRLTSLHDNLKLTLFIPTTTSTTAAAAAAAAAAAITTTTTASSTHQTKPLQSLDSLPPNLHVINLPSVDPTASMDPSDTEPMTRISNTIKLSLPSLRSAIVNSSPKPTILIVDIFGTDAFETAESLNMSKYLYVTINATAFAYMAHAPKLQDWDSPRVPGCKQIPIEDLGQVFIDRSSRTHEFFLQHAHQISKASGVLVNTFEELEQQTVRSLTEGLIDVPRVYAVGPLVKSSLGQTIGKVDCLTWLDAQPLDSVLFVSFGSGGTLSGEQITELAWGLEMSQQRFIWVARAPHEKVASAAYFDANGELTNLSGFLPDGFLTRTQDIGLVIPNWAPQIEILSHESVGGFLSHCGWNSSLESIVNGVPLIACPLFAEQGMNACILEEDLKVAVRLSSRGVVRRDEIEKMVRLVMEEEEGKELRRRAKELKESAKVSFEKGGSSYSALSQVVEQWKTDSRVRHMET